MHAGADLRLDGTEPAYHRALVRPDDVESRGQMGSKKKDKNAKDPIAIAKPEARSSRTRPQSRLRASDLLRLGLLLAARRRPVLDRTRMSPDLLPEFFVQE